MKAGTVYSCPQAIPGGIIPSQDLHSNAPGVANSVLGQFGIRNQPNLVKFLAGGFYIVKTSLNIQCHFHVRFKTELIMKFTLGHNWDVKVALYIKARFDDIK